MKIKFLCSLLFVIVLTSVAVAQSVVVTPKKITYNRRQPTADFKKSFVVTYPKVKAATPALSRKIESEISYEKNNNLKLSEELGEYQWLEEASYEVVYNKNGLLDIILITDGSAAYPSAIIKEVVINLKTGTRLTAQDVFINLDGLAAVVRKNQAAEIVKANQEYKQDPESADFDGNEYFDAAKFGVNELNEFSVSDAGVTFKYDYGFPHAVLALQPDGTYFYKWAQIKRFIKPGGLLGKFVR